MAEKKLPPLPGSDERTLKENKFDPFYEKKPSDLWKGGYVENVRLKKPQKCKHYFEEKKDGSVFCRNCHMGLEGHGLTVKKGHVFFGDQRLL